MNAIFDSIRKIGFRRGPDRIVGGIAGGLAKVTRLNVWLVRILVLLSFLLPVSSNARHPPLRSPRLA